MTNRKQDLIELRDNVAAGVWPDDTTPIGEISYEAQAHLMLAFNGSLDAAKALHEAVLPEQSIRIEKRVGGWVVWLDNPFQGINDNPARAWLLAIISALIAQEAAT